MSNKQQTAADWLFDNLNLCFDKFDNGEYSYTEFVNASNEIKKQAKELEKQQVIDGYDQMRCIGNFENGEQYYNETYEQTNRN